MTGCRVFGTLTRGDTHAERPFVGYIALLLRRPLQLPQVALEVLSLLMVCGVGAVDAAQLTVTLSMLPCEAP